MPTVDKERKKREKSKTNNQMKKTKKRGIKRRRESVLSGKWGTEDDREEEGNAKLGREIDKGS